MLVPACHYLIDNGEVDDLHLVLARSPKVSAMGAGCIAKLCLHDQQGIRNPGQHSTLGSLYPVHTAAVLVLGASTYCHWSLHRRKLQLGLS